MHQSRNSPIPSQSDNNNNRAQPPPPPDGLSIRSIICIILIKLIFFVVILYCIILWSILFFAIVESHVVGVSLTQFDLNTTTNKLQLDYNLTVDIDVKNPNRVVDVNYEEIEVRAFYQGNRFDSVNLMPFYQGHHHKKNKTTSVHPVFQGQAFLAIPSWDNNKYSELIDGFNRDKSDGRFDIQVQLHFKVMYELARFRRFDKKSKPMCKCDLKRVPLISSTMHSNYSSTSSNDHADEFRINTKCALKVPIHSHA